MPFNLAEARLSTIKELQKQLKKWKKYCGKAEDRLDKQMKLNEDLQEEIKKLKEVKYPVTFQKTYKIQQEEIKKLKQFKTLTTKILSKVFGIWKKILLGSPNSRKNMNLML